MPFKPTREIRLKAFSSAYEYVKQYPQQSSSGRRELRAMEKENQKDRPQAGTSLSRDRSKMNSVDTVDTAIYSPAVLNDLANGTTSQDAGHARRSLARSSTQSDGTAAQSKSIHSVDTDLPQSPNFDMDDAPGMAAAPAELSKRGIHIPTRTRYVPACIVTSN